MDPGRCSAENLEGKEGEMIDWEFRDGGVIGLESWIRQSFAISGEARVVVIGADGSPSVSFSVEMSLSAVCGVFFTEVA